MAKKTQKEDAMTRVELENQILREMLAKAMSAKTAPRAAVQPDTTQPDERDWSKVIHTCPKCGRSGPVSELFGTRLVRGIRQKQSYCSHCRGQVASTVNFKRRRAYVPRKPR